MILAIGIDLYGWHSVIAVDRDIQQQRNTIICELELLPDQAGGGSSLPAYFVLELTAHAVLAYKTRAERQSLSGVVQGVLEGIPIKVIVKHYVTNVGQTEIGQRKAQYEIWITITHSITEQRTASEVGTGVGDLVAKTDAIAVIDVKAWRLINTDFLLCFQPGHTIIVVSDALLCESAETDHGIVDHGRGHRSQYDHGHIHYGRILSVGVGDHKLYRVHSTTHFRI